MTKCTCRKWILEFHSSPNSVPLIERGRKRGGKACISLLKDFLLTLTVSPLKDSLLTVITCVYMHRCFAAG